MAPTAASGPLTLAESLTASLTDLLASRAETLLLGEDVAVDDGPVARHALVTGIELAQSLEGEIGLVHVVDSALIQEPETVLVADDLERDAEERGRRLLAETRREAPEDLALVAEAMQRLRDA